MQRLYTRLCSAVKANWYNFYSKESVSKYSHFETLLKIQLVICVLQEGAVSDLFGSRENRDFG
ncbi:hypothetical protein [Oscillatoria salina]|uniref:hypothetical protein n=1 Tax=Oscillatoria salina TaxID=331517 RepID=UPI0013BC7FA7|nr:hypothetical protein [Oscillatoria salina]MBZ8182310.1 hypothetical protein [Oscillatoria salina IIICB1]NET90565.1 hypothetical protein [Kamptonema sp. SIO1D9]